MNSTGRGPDPFAVYRQMDRVSVTGFHRLVFAYPRRFRRGRRGRKQRGGGRERDAPCDRRAHRMPTMAFHSFTNVEWVFKNASQSSGIKCLKAVIGKPSFGGCTSARAEYKAVAFT